MLDTNQIYLTTLIHLLEMHPGANRVAADWQHWSNLTFTERALPEEAIRMAAAGKVFEPLKASGPLRAIFDYLGASEISISKSSVSATPTSWPQNLKFLLDAAPKHSDPGKAAEQLFFILEETCTGIASGWHEGVSLFDFTRLSAAAAVCLSGNENNDSPFLLISGGLSGIQEYLYDIVSRKASKNLKGRSFFLQLLSDTMVMELLHDLGLFRANVLSSSGSKFILLAPNTPETRQKLVDFSNKASARLFSSFKTRIFLEIDWCEMPDLTPASFTDAIGKIALSISQKKQHKFSDILRSPAVRTDERKMAVSGYDYFFEPLDVNGEEDRDVITNEEIFDINDALPLDAENPDELVKKLTQHQIQLGRVLNQSEFLVSGRTKVATDDAKWGGIQVSGSPVLHHLTNKLSEKAPDNLVLRLGEPAINWSHKNTEAICGFYLFAGNKVPMSDTHQPKTFEELADDGLSRFKRLGFLRMDVDGLGMTLKQLFDQTVNPRFPQSVAAFCSFSRSLDYFMKGMLNNMWIADPAFQEYIQITYAGGDDLFIVGKWNEVVRFAKQIRQAFRDWVSGFEGLSISGGIELVTSKFPTIRAVDEAGRAEDAAKAHYFLDKKGNSITLFKQPLNWDSEFPIVERLKDEMVALSENGALPRGFFSKIQGLYEQAVYQNKTQRTEAWRWRIAYDFAKMMERKSKSADLKALLTEMQLLVMSGRGKFQVYPHADGLKNFNLVRLAANWADFETRDKSA